MPEHTLEAMLTVMVADDSGVLLVEVERHARIAYTAEDGGVEVDLVSVQDGEDEPSRRAPWLLDLIERSPVLLDRLLDHAAGVAETEREAMAELRNGGGS